MEPTAPGFLIVKPCVNTGKLTSFPSRNPEGSMRVNAVGTHHFSFQQQNQGFQN